MTASRGARHGAGDGSTPEEPEMTLVKLTSMPGVTSCRASEYVEKNWFGEPGYTYAGFPAQSGSGSAYQILSSLGLGQQCSDPDGAKAFFEFCFFLFAGRCASCKLPAPAVGAGGIQGR